MSIENLETITREAGCTPAETHALIRQSFAIADGETLAIGSTRHVTALVGCIRSLRADLADIRAIMGAK